MITVYNRETKWRDSIHRDKRRKGWIGNGWRGKGISSCPKGSENPYTISQNMQVILSYVEKDDKSSLVRPPRGTEINTAKTIPESTVLKRTLP